MNKMNTDGKCQIIFICVHLWLKENAWLNEKV
jgi:hypothetical protein